MNLPSLTAAAASAPADLRKAKQAWSDRVLAPAAAGAFRARAAASVPGDNVVGVGIGEKITWGRPTGVLAVKFFVRVKYALDELPKADRLPETIDGLPVDVEQAGTFRALAVPNPRIKRRPAQPGCSVGHQIPGGGGVMAGTFGAVVKKGSRLFILSNNHVLADEGRLPLGEPIFQPGLLDGGNPATDRLAELTAFRAFRPSGNIVDAAIAKADAAGVVSRDVLFIGPPTGKVAAAIDMAVHKFGRTTRYTVGRIVSTDTDVTVQYDTGNFVFNDQIVIVGTGGTFSRSGDSGSLILQRGTNKAVGLLFAGSATHTIANHIGKALKAMKVTLA